MREKNDRAQVKEIEKGWQEFWAGFFRIRHRHAIEGIRDFDRKLASHIIETLELKPDDRVLDLACGGGDQAIELARRGMGVVGVDIAHSLVDYANSNARNEHLQAEFMQGDMRETRFREEFDSCMILCGFGFFDDGGNRQVLDVVRNALKEGGQFYIFGPNPLTRIREHWKGWEMVNDGYLLMESRYDTATGRTTDGFRYFECSGGLIVFKQKPEDKGFSLETRWYTLPEMIDLIETAQLVFRAAYGSIELPPEEYTIASKEMVVVGRKPSPIPI